MAAHPRCTPRPCHPPVAGSFLLRRRLCPDDNSGQRSLNLSCRPLPCAASGRDARLIQSRSDRPQRRCATVLELLDCRSHVPAALFRARLHDGRGLLTSLCSRLCTAVAPQCYASPLGRRESRFCPSADHASLKFGNGHRLLQQKAASSPLDLTTSAPAAPHSRPDGDHTGRREAQLALMLY